MKHKILALDISTKSTGWFFDLDNYGIITLDINLSLAKKLVLFRKELNKLLIKFKPKIVIIEDVYYRPGFGNIHTVKVLSKFSGVATELISSKKIKVIIVTTSAARKSLGLKHKVTKKDVFNFFIEKFKVDWNYNRMNDVTDAWVLKYAYEEGYKDK